MSQEDKYPSWRDALFGDNTVANIRCGVKYVIWHSAYAALTVVGLLLVGAIMLVRGLLGLIPGERLASVAEGGVSVIEKPMSVVGKYLFSDTATKIAEWVAIVGFVACAIGIVCFTVYLAVTETVAFFTVAGMILGSIVVAVVVSEIVDRYGGPAASKMHSGYSKVGDKAIETPGVRRVYGRCPVSLDSGPKWFNKVDEFMKNLDDD